MTLLDTIGYTVRVVAEAPDRYPDNPALQDTFAAAAWKPVAAEYTRLLTAVSVAAQ